MIALKGLRINNPQAIMASYGLLRILDHQGLTAHLYWREDNVAVIEDIEWPPLVEAVTTYIRGREQAPELNWQAKLSGLSMEDYRTLYRESRNGTREWINAYWYLKGPNDGAAWSKLDLTARKCRVSLCASIRDSISLVSAPEAKRARAQGKKRGVEEYLRAALLDPWANDDDVSSVGWDPGAAKLGAVIAGGHDPSATRHRSVAAAMWLAWESMPLFPARWLAGDRTEVIFVVPQRPVSLAGAQLMLLSGPHLGTTELAAQGWSNWQLQIWTQGEMAYFTYARTVSNDERAEGSRTANSLTPRTDVYSPRKFIV